MATAQSGAVDPMNATSNTVEQIASTATRVKRTEAEGTNPPEIKPDGIYTLPQIQAAANVSRPTLYRWRNGGGLKEIRVGNVVRIRGKDFLQFLERYSTKEESDENTRSK